MRERELAPIQAVAFVLFCVLAAIIHDQITARACAKYFTIRHAPLFAFRSESLRTLGF